MNTLHPHNYLKIKNFKKRWYIVDTMAGMKSLFNCRISNFRRISGWGVEIIKFLGPTSNVVFMHTWSVYNVKRYSVYKRHVFFRDFLRDFFCSSSLPPPPCSESYALYYILLTMFSTRGEQTERKAFSRRRCYCTFI